jgi:hypothetical protein
LDDEFLRYCELNHIEDVQKLAHETFKRGFTILKYGETPSVNVKVLKELKEKARHEIDTPGHPDYGKPIYTFTEEELKKIEKVDKNNLYDE